MKFSANRLPNNLSVLFLLSFWDSGDMNVQPWYIPTHPWGSVNSFFLINFNWKLITLQYSSGFCHILTRISHGCTSVPHPEPHFHLLTHPLPEACPSAPALSAPFHASNLDWCSISYMVIYMLHCYSLKSSHPHLLPQSPKVYSLYLCIFCCLAYRVIITIFLNSIYMH